MTLEGEVKSLMSPAHDTYLKVIQFDKQRTCYTKSYTCTYNNIYIYNVPVFTDLFQKGRCVRRHIVF